MKEKEMKYNVDHWNNFCRVFELPESFPAQYCFSGGVLVLFKMVDWFYPVSDVDQAAVSKEVWEKEVGPIETTEIDLGELEKIIIPFLLQKRYVGLGRTYLVLYEFGGSSVFTA